MYPIDKILVWFFIIGDLSASALQKKVPAPTVTGFRFFAEACLGILLGIVCYRFLLKKYIYPKRILIGLVGILFLTMLQKFFLHLETKDLIYGLRSYLKYPLFFLVLVNVFLSYKDYRVIFIFFRWLILFSIPLTVFEYFFLQWGSDQAGGIFSSGEVAVFGVFMFFLELSLGVLTRKVEHFFMLLGILLIFLTAETKVSFFLVPAGLVFLLFRIRTKLAFGVIGCAFFAIICGVLLSDTFVQRSDLKGLFLYPSKAVHYLISDKCVATKNLFSPREYSLCVEKNNAGKLNRIPSILFAWHEIKQTLFSSFLGKGIGVATEYAQKDNKYLQLHLQSTQLSKGLIELGLLGFFLYLLFIVHQIKFPVFLNKSMTHPLDQAMIFLLLPVTACYFAAVIYNQVFYVSSSAIFFWSLIGYGNKIQESG